MDSLIALVIGLLVGWLVAWLVDRRFWLGQYRLLREELAKAEDQVRALQEARKLDKGLRKELGQVKAELRTRSSSNEGYWRQKLARAEAQIRALQEARENDKHLREELARAQAQIRALRGSTAGSPDEGAARDWRQAQVSRWEESEND